MNTDRIFNQYAQVLEQAALVSMDIFDTLLFRGCAQPKDVFLLAASKAQSAGLLPDQLTVEEFRTLRVSAERRARAAKRESCGSDEITLEEIYAQLPVAWSERDRLVQFELETEREVCYINPHAAALLAQCKERGIPVVLLSDMYLSAEQIGGLLTAAGLNLSLVDKILVSSEHGCSKYSSELFEKLSSHYPGIDPAAIVHIGDHPISDVERAHQHGLQAIHYSVVPERFGSPYHWESVRHGSLLPELRSLRKLAGASRADFFFDFGATRLGPFLHALCEWAVDTCVREGRTEIHPLMREAVLLGPMLEQVARARGVSLKVTPIYLSRQATYLPRMSRFGKSEAQDLIAQHGITVRDVFEVLDISEEAASYEGGLDDLVEFLLSARIHAKIVASIERARGRFMRYIRQECGSWDRLLTLDIGFNGTIQRALNEIYRLAGVQHQNIHLMAVGTERSPEHHFEGMDLRCYIGSAGEHGDLGGRIARSPSFLEELMMGTFGSTLGYEEDATGKFHPILGKLQNAPEEFAWKRSCQDGALAFQEYFYYLHRTKPGLVSGLFTRERRREWAAVFQRVIDMPTPEEAAQLGALTHQDQFCGIRIDRICEPVEDRWFRRGAQGFMEISNLGPNVLNVFWPQGVATLREPYFLYETLLKANSGFGYDYLLFQLAQRLRNDGVDSVYVVGLGSFAEQVGYRLEFFGIHIVSWLDPEQLPELNDGIHPYFVLATLSQMEDYRTRLKSAYPMYARLFLYEMVDS